jgi:hypothetical protein
LGNSTPASAIITRSQAQSQTANMTDKSIWNKPIAVPASVISYVDDAVKARKSISSRILKPAVQIRVPIRPFVNQVRHEIE